HPAVPAGVSRTNFSRLVLGQLHRPERGHGACCSRQDPPHPQDVHVRPDQRIYRPAENGRSCRQGCNEILIVRPRDPAEALLQLKRKLTKWQRSTRLSAHAVQSNSSSIPIPPSSPSVTALTARRRPAVKRPRSSACPRMTLRLSAASRRRFATSPSRARALIETSAPIAAPGCSPATWTASRERSSSHSAAWITLRASL